MPVTTEKYEAIVSKIEGFDNDEDEKRGAIEVICPGLMADDETPLPILCEPVHDWGWFYIPDVGEAVEIEVVTTSDRDEVWGQQTLEALAPTWRGKRHYTDVEPEGEDPRPIHVDFTDTNYGKRRGFTTPFGHVFLFDDTEDDQRIYITHMAEQLEPGATPEAAKFTRIEIEPDGSLKIAFLNKHMIHLTTEKGNLRIALDGEPGSEKHTIEFDAETPKLEVSLAEGDSIVKIDGSVPSVDAQLAGGDHNMTLDPDKFTANLGGGATVKFEAKDGGAKMTVGDGAKHVPIVETLQTLWDALKSYLDAHDHTVTDGKAIVSGGSGSPAIGVNVPTTSLPPNQSAPAWDTAINSTKIAIPDG